MVSTAAGFVCTIIAILSNGSFAAFVKIPRVQQCKMEPLTFVLFLTLGVALSSFVSPLFYSVLPDAPPHAVFTWWGFLGGFLFTMSSVFSFTAIKFVGLALAQGLWGGAALLVSFLWGAAAFGNHIKSGVLAALALVLLLIGVAGIALCEQIAKRLCNKPQSPSQQLLQDEEEAMGFVQASDGRRQSVPLDVEKNGDAAHTSVPLKNIGIGLGCAVGVGVFGGSILAPQHYAPADVADIGFLFSFGIGALVSGPVVLLVETAVTRKVPKFESWTDLWVALAAGVASGAWWNIGNACAIYGIIGLGYAVAYSLVQTALFVSGLLGIFVYREIRGAAIGVFFASGAVLTLGAVLLAVYA